MRILITGSRNWGDDVTIIKALHEAIASWGIKPGSDEEIIIVHGGATGADAIAKRWALSKKLFGEHIRDEPHPAKWGVQGTAAGPIRNQEMIDAGADICLAFPLGESPGTRDCMRRAKKAGIPVINYGDQ